MAHSYLLVPPPDHPSNLLKRKLETPDEPGTPAAKRLKPLILEMDPAGDAKEDTTSFARYSPAHCRVLEVPWAFHRKKHKKFAELFHLAVKKLSIRTFGACEDVADPTKASYVFEYDSDCGGDSGESEWLLTAADVAEPTFFSAFWITYDSKIRLLRHIGDMARAEGLDEKQLVLPPCMYWSVASPGRECPLPSLQHPLDNDVGSVCNLPVLRRMARLLMGDQKLAVLQKARCDGRDSGSVTCLTAFALLQLAIIAAPHEWGAVGSTSADGYYPASAVANFSEVFFNYLLTNSFPDSVPHALRERMENIAQSVRAIVRRDAVAGNDAERKFSAAHLLWVTHLAGFDAVMHETTLPYAERSVWNESLVAIYGDCPVLTLSDMEGDSILDGNMRAVSMSKVHTLREKHGLSERKWYQIEGLGMFELRAAATQCKIEQLLFEHAVCVPVRWKCGNTVTNRMLVYTTEFVFRLLGLYLRALAEIDISAQNARFRSPDVQLSPLCVEWCALLRRHVAGKALDDRGVVVFELEQLLRMLLWWLGYESDAHRHSLGVLCLTLPQIEDTLSGHPTLYANAMQLLFASTQRDVAFSVSDSAAQSHPYISKWVSPEKSTLTPAQVVGYIQYQCAHKADPLPIEVSSKAAKNRSYFGAAEWTRDTGRWTRHCANVHTEEVRQARSRHTQPFARAAVVLDGMAHLVPVGHESVQQMSSAVNTFDSAWQFSTRHGIYGGGQRLICPVALESNDVLTNEAQWLIDVYKSNMQDTVDKLQQQQSS